MLVWVVNHYAIPPAYGGLNRHFYFSKELKNKDVKTRIFTSSKIHNTEINLIKDNNLNKEIEFDGVEYTFVKTSDYSGNGFKRLFSFLQFPINVYRTMTAYKRKEVPDIIYASSPELFATWCAVRFAKKNSIPIIVEIRDLWPESIVSFTRFTQNNVIIKILYKLERWIYEKADRIIFTFEGGKDYIKKQKWDIENGGKIYLNKVRYLNNGVDIALFNENLKKYKIEDDELEREDVFKIVYTGSIRRANSLNLLIDAVKMLKDTKEKISVILYGDGTEKDSLIEECEKYELTNVHFRDRVDKKYVPGILKRADTVIFVGETGEIDKYGLSLNKLFDYMASGKPLISNIETNYDNILKYNCGIVVPKNSPEAIAEGILQIKNLEESKYNDYCNNAVLAATDFDFKKLSSDLNNIFNEIVKEKKYEVK